MKKQSTYTVTGGRNLNKGWTRSVCDSIHYPVFEQPVAVELPDHAEKEIPDFGGVIRYEQEVELRPEEIQHAVLEISDAGEAVQVFVNGADCGIQIIPPYRYEIDKLLITGKTGL